VNALKELMGIVVIHLTHNVRLVMLAAWFVITSRDVLSVKDRNTSVIIWNNVNHVYPTVNSVATHPPVLDVIKITMKTITVSV